MLLKYKSSVPTIYLLRAAHNHGSLQLQGCCALFWPLQASTYPHIYTILIKSFFFFQLKKKKQIKKVVASQNRGHPVVVSIGVHDTFVVLAPKKLRQDYHSSPGVDQPGQRRKFHLKITQNEIN